jgi:CheY-like chemotaxis protein
MTILYADDDPEDQEIFVDALKELVPKANLLLASHGKEVLGILQGNSAVPDIIFLDINMPVMGGKDCLVKLKLAESTRDIPVVMYTTTSNRFELQKYLALGAKDYIVKDHSFQRIKSELKRTLNEMK